MSTGRFQVGSNKAQKVSLVLNYRPLLRGNHTHLISPRELSNSVNCLFSDSDQPRAEVISTLVPVCETFPLFFPLGPRYCHEILPFGSSFADPETFDRQAVFCL
jgi:hypothetical protein